MQSNTRLILIPNERGYPGYSRSPYHPIAPTKKALAGPFVLKPKSLGQPRLDGVRAAFRFPLFQRFVVATFRFDYFAGVRIFINRQLTRLYRVPTTEG